MLPSQPQLFEDVVAPSSAALVRMEGSQRKLSAAQRRFNRLVEQIDAARGQLALWTTHGERFRMEAGRELAARRTELCAASTALIHQLYELLQPAPRGMRLKPPARQALKAFLCDLCFGVLSQGANPEIEALHDRYSELAMAEKRRLDDEAERGLTEAMLAEVFGEAGLEEIKGADGDELSIEAMLERASQRARQEQRAGLDFRTPPGERARRGAVRMHKQAEQASASVREVYRALVRQIHPDRERDEQARLHKTELLQRINQAFKAGDLLTLLTLQREVEGFDAASSARLPEQRLSAYNRLLAEQLRLVKAELQGYQDGLLMWLEVDEPIKLQRPQQLAGLLQQQLRELQLEIDDTIETRQALADPATRQGCVQQIRREQEQLRRMAEADERLFDEMFGEAFGDHDDENFPAADDDEDWISFDEPDLPSGFVPGPFGAAPVVLPKRQSKKRKKKGKGKKR